jgi:hypothetical protein
MGIWSDGSYGIEEGIYYSFPVTCANGNYSIVQNIPIPKDTAKKMQISNDELCTERDAVMPSLGLKKENVKDTFTKWKTVFDKEGKLPGFYPPKI